ncbi:MAG: glycosyltransferase [Planctomycetes bacterium]|nr:glycosyltransferase [Planctomycetota bacterium]
MKRAYVIGNDPCLNQIDIKKLSSETTISFDRAYIAYEEWGFYPTYFMCVDEAVLENIKYDINRLIKYSPIEHFFLPDWIKPSIIESHKVTFIHLSKEKFFGTVFNDLSLLGNVGACSVQILNILGYDQIVLLGSDCCYQKSDLERAELENWRYLSQNALAYGIEIISSSPGSKLNTIFPYIEFESVILSDTEDLNVLNKVVSSINSEIDGRWCGLKETQIEYCKIVDELCKNISQPCVLLEIGTLYGGSAIAALMIAKLRGVLDLVKVICIDPLYGYYKKGTLDSAGEISFERTRDNFYKFGFEDKNFELITKKSNEVDLSRFADDSIKLLFIDGDHSYEGVKYDWEHYGKLVDDDGIILFDNYADRIDSRTGNKVWPGVKKFVDNEVIPNEDVNIQSSNAEIMVISCKNNNKSTCCGKFDLANTPHTYLFMPSNDTHVHYMLSLSEKVGDSQFLIRSKIKENSEYYLRAYRKDFVVYQPDILKTINPSVVVLGIDWSPQERQIIEEAKQLGIPTVCIQEGCLDFLDQSKGRLMHSEYIFLHGPVMRKYLQRQEGLIVTGNPKYDDLYETPLPEKPMVIINCNFTYDIYEEFRNQWVTDTANACKQLGLDFFISQHPRDNGVFPSEYKVVKSGAFKLRSQLEQSSILIARFSTVIYEALMMGREAVYYNPHNEPFRIFAEDDTGGIGLANDYPQLVSALELAVNNLDSNKANRHKFLKQHCGTLNHDATNRCAEYLRRIAEGTIHEKPLIDLDKCLTLRDDATVQSSENLAKVSRIANFRKIAGKAVKDVQDCSSIIAKGKESKVRISVVLATYRRADYLAMALECLSKQTLDKELYEIIVVDNNSRDNTKEVVDRYPSFKYILEEELGLSPARNTGIRAAVGDFITFIDDDSEADPNWLKTLVDMHDKYPDAWVVGGKILLKWDAEPPEWLTESNYNNLGLRNLGDIPRQLSYPEGLAGSNCSFIKEVFSQIGYFKSELGRIGRIQLAHEETEIQTRIYQEGHKIYYNPNALVYHHISASRMTKAYFAVHALGNFISNIFIKLCEEGKTDEVSQFVNEFRNKLKNSTPEMVEAVEVQFLEGVYSRFLQKDTDYYNEMKFKFCDGALRYYWESKKYEMAEKRCLEWLLLPNVSKTQFHKLLLQLASIYLKQDKIDDARKILDDIIHEDGVDTQEMYQLFINFEGYYSERGQLCEMGKLIDGILNSNSIPLGNKATVVWSLNSFYVNQGKFEEVEQWFLKMLSQQNVENETKDKLLLGLGDLYIRCERFEDAKKVLEQAVAVEEIIAQEKSEAKPALSSSCDLNIETQAKGLAGNNKVRISVVLATYRRADYLALALESLSNQTLDRQLYEIIVVDNNSGDNTREVVDRYPSFKYILEEELGLSPARNAGIRASVGDFITFLDDDAEADPNWLKALVETHDNHPDAWVVGGRILLKFDVQPPQWLTESNHRDLGFRDFGDIARELNYPEGLAGSNCSFKRKVFTEIGYFKPQLGRIGNIQLSHEERDIQIHIYEQGHTIYYNPAAFVHHHVSAERMNKAYFANHAFSNFISKMFIRLSDEGRGNEVCQLVNQFRDIARSNTSRSAQEIDGLFAENVYSNFLQKNSGVPIEQAVQFYSYFAKYYLELENYEKAEDKSLELVSLLDTSGTHRNNFISRMTNVHSSQDPRDRSQKIFNDALSTTLEVVSISRDISDEAKISIVRHFCAFHLDSGKYNEAEQMYLKMCSAGHLGNAGKAKLFLGLGDLYSRCGRVEDAKDVLTKAVLFENAIEQEKSLSQSSATTSPDVSDSLSHVRDLSYSTAKKYPAEPEKLTDLADKMYSGNDIEAAVVVLRSCIEIYPEHLNAYLGLSNTFLNQKRLKDAADVMKLAGNATAEAMPHLVIFGNSCQQQGHLAEAKDLYEQALVMSPDESDILSRLGNVCYELGDYRDALNNFKSAEVIEPDKIETLIGLVATASKLGETELFKKAYKQAYALEPTAKVLTELADDYKKLCPEFNGIVKVDILNYQESANSSVELSCAPVKNDVIDDVKANDDIKLLEEIKLGNPNALVLPEVAQQAGVLFENIQARSNRLLTQYKNKYQGQRCVIIGNGPSLNNTDLSLLKNEYTFGLNKIYLLFDKFDWRPTFYVAVNQFVIEQSAKQILNEISGLKFLDFVSFKYLPYRMDTIYTRPLNGNAFSTDPCIGVFQAHTVTYVAMQLAYYLGFSEVFLVGVDHFYNAAQKGKPNQVIVQHGRDSDHFDSGYFEQGREWHLPDLKGSEKGYKTAKLKFEQVGKKIYDATVGGHLDVFEKVDFNDVFGKQSRRTASTQNHSF